MNIALGALILFILLFPGIILRISYLNGPYSKRNIQSSLVDELVASIIPALFIQSGGFLFCEYFLTYNISLEPVYQLIIGSNVKDYRPDFAFIEGSIVYFVSYNVSLLIFSLLLGKFARWVVKKLMLDVRFPSLRYNNEWYYLFSGRIMDFDNHPGSSEGIAEYPFINVVIETKEASYIYRGFLQHYILSKDGLDRIYMSSVYRRKMSEDKPEEEHQTSDLEQDSRYYFIPGEFFVIPGNQIKTLNVEYFRIVKEDETPEKKRWFSLPKIRKKASSDESFVRKPE